MKKIYITSLHLGHGGVEKMICNLANLFVEMGHEVEIINTYFLNEPVYSLDKRVGLTYLTNRKPNRDRIRKYFKTKKIFKLIIEVITAIKTIYLKKVTMKRFIRTIDNSIIISTRNEHSVLINKASSGTNKLIAQLHHDHKFNKKLLKEIKFKYTNFDYLLLLTEELKQEISKELLGFNDRIKCVTVPNFLSNLIQIEEVTRKNQIIAVGRLHNDKGFDRLLVVWESFQKMHPEYLLKIVGDGPLMQELNMLAVDYGIENSVRFVGSLSNEETLREIRMSKIFAMTSISEAFPLVLLEALSQGTPVVAYDVRVGPRSIITNGHDGYLVKDDQSLEFSNKLDLLIQDQVRYENFSNNATATSSKYSEEALRHKWLDILSE